MLAVAWPWHDATGDRYAKLSERLGASLCAGIGGHAGSAEIAGVHAASRPLQSSAALARAWRPAVLPGGWIVLFNGYFDNATELAAELGSRAGDIALLYGLAVERWGDGAER